MRDTNASGPSSGSSDSRSQTRTRERAPIGLLLIDVPLGLMTATATYFMLWITWASVLDCGNPIAVVVLLFALGATGVVAYSLRQGYSAGIRSTLRIACLTWVIFAVPLAFVAMSGIAPQVWCD